MQLPERQEALATSFYSIAGFSTVSVGIKSISHNFKKSITQQATVILSNKMAKVSLPLFIAHLMTPAFRSRGANAKWVRSYGGPAGVTATGSNDPAPKSGYSPTAPSNTYH